MRQDNAQAAKVHSSPATRLDLCPLVKDAEDTVEVRRFDQAVPAVRVQCAAPPARVAVGILIRLMMAHLNPKALQHVVEPEIELRLDALAERIALGRAPAPSSHGRPATQSLSSRAWCKPLPTRDCQLNLTLPIRTNITRRRAPEGRAPQHEAESAPGWAGQQRRSTRNRRGVTAVPASVSRPAQSQCRQTRKCSNGAPRSKRRNNIKPCNVLLDDRNIPNKGL